MINRIINFSIHNKLAIGLFTIALIIYGSYSLKELPIDAVPDITNNQVLVITVSPTLATQEVEQFVTYPIERSMATLPDMTEIRSISRFGLSVVTIVFKEKVNIYFARQLVNERLKEAEGEIPPNAGSPELAPVSSGLGEVYQYILHPKKGFEKKYSAMDLRTMQDWIVARQLLGTPGVAEVNSFGGYLKQYEVAIDPLKLKSMNVTIPEVFEALQKNNENTGGAYIDKKPSAYFIRGLGLVNSLDDVGKIVVKSNSNGTPVLVRDVATPQIGNAIRYGAITRNGEGEVVGGIVMMLKGANSAEVVNAVKEKMPKIKKSLPEGVEIEAFLDRTNLVNRAMHTVAENLILGFLIVVFVLILFIGNFRAGLIVASVIPLAMLFAIIMMNVFGVSGNLMSLGAIDFGIIVDGAVIIIEAVVHRIFLSPNHYTGILRLNREQMDHEVSGGVGQVVHSSSFGQIIILIVYLPILALVGIEGKMFTPMAQTVSFAILGAFILSITYLPMAASIFLSKNTEHKENISDRMMNWLHKIYEPIVLYSLKNKWKIVTVSIMLFVFSFFIFSRMGGEFIPTLEEGDFAFESSLPEGTSLSQVVETYTQVEKILMKFPEVKEVICKIGAAEIPTDPMPVNASDITVILKDKSEWTTAHSRQALADTMEAAIHSIPGIFAEASQPIQLRFNELISGVRQDVAVKIFGENMDTLNYYADKVSKVISSVNGTAAPKIEATTGLPQITIHYNRDKMALYGVNVSNLNMIVRTAFAGESAGVIFENERRFDLVLRLDTAHRSSIEDVQNLYVPIPTGGQIPLQQLAEIDFEIGPAQITREDAKRRISIGFNVPFRDIKSAVTEVQQKLDKQVKLPSGYYFAYGGQFKNLEEASKRLTLAVPVALAMIFILLFFAFGDFKQCLLVFSAIPLSAIGGIIALWIAGMPFSVSAGIGFIALFGVSVLNGIVLIDYFNQLEKSGVTDIYQRVMQGTKTRFRSILMTGAVPALGFLPMVISTSAGAEVQKPLAIVVIGGLITATLLTLIVLPALYILFSGKKRIKVSAGVVIPILFMLSQNTNAQTVLTQKLSLDSCVAVAFRNNPNLSASQLDVQSNQKLQKTAFDFGKTGVFYENEDLNSSNKTDKGIVKIGITQSFDFPTTYFAQSRANKQNTLLAQTSLSLTEKELLQNVRSAYFNLGFAVSKQNLLKQQDSIYTDFESAAKIRFQTGETNKLELISAQAKHKEIQLNLQVAEADVIIAQQELTKWMNSTVSVLPTNSNTEKLQSPVSNYQTQIKSHPYLELSQQKISLAEYQRKVEVNKLLPDLNIRYFNQNWYGVSPGYYGYSVGIGIPLFFWSQQGRIQSAKLQQQIAQKNFENDQLVFNAAYNEALQEFQKNNSSLSYYEQTGLAQADEILASATLAYKNGEIGYVEYTTLLSQSIDIKNNFVASLNNYNQSVIKLNYFLNK